MDFLWSVACQSILVLNWELVRMCGLVKPEAPGCAQVAIILIT